MTPSDGVTCGRFACEDLLKLADAPSLVETDAGISLKGRILVILAEVHRRRMAVDAAVTGTFGRGE